MKILKLKFIPVNVYLLLLTLINAYAQDSITFSSRELGNTLYLFEVNGVNIIAAQGPEGNVLVDAGYKEAAPLLRKKMAESGIGFIKFLVNTHWHFDHTGGNTQFAKESCVISGNVTKELLSSEQQLMGELQKPLPVWARPSLIVEDTVTINTGDEIIKVISMPGGHTGGDVVVWFTKAGILHIGDIIFSDMFPFVDTGHGGNVFRLADVIASLILTFPDDTRFIPGHGRELSKADLKEYEKMIRTTADLVRTEYLNKKSAEAITQMKVLEKWKKWGVAFTCDDWIDMIIKSL